MPEKARPDPPLAVPLVSGADKNYRNEKYFIFGSGVYHACLCTMDDLQ